MRINYFGLMMFSFWAHPAYATPNLILNRGFETGDFSDWTQSGWFVHTTNPHSRLRPRPARWMRDADAVADALRFRKAHLAFPDRHIKSVSYSPVVRPHSVSAFGR